MEKVRVTRNITEFLAIFKIYMYIYIYIYIYIGGVASLKVYSL